MSATVSPSTSPVELQGAVEVRSGEQPLDLALEFGTAVELDVGGKGGGGGASTAVAMGVLTRAVSPTTSPASAWLGTRPIMYG